MAVCLVTYFLLVLSIESCNYSSVKGPHLLDTSDVKCKLEQNYIVLTLWVYLCARCTRSCFNFFLFLFLPLPHNPSHPAGVIPDESKALSLLAPANAVAGLLPGGGLLPTPNPVPSVSDAHSLFSVYCRVRVSKYHSSNFNLTHLIHLILQEHLSVKGCCVGRGLHNEQLQYCDTNIKKSPVVVVA